MNPLIDARRIGETEDRTHRILPDADIAKIADTYHAWRGDSLGEYGDIPGFRKADLLEEVRTHGHILTSGRYVGAAATQEDGEPFGAKLDRLTSTLESQFEINIALQTKIETILGAFRNEQ